MTRASEASAAAQSSGAAFEAWCDEQHRAARAAGWLVWVDHYGPEVRHIVRGRYKIVGPAPPDYLGQLRGGRTLLVEAKRRTGRLLIEGDDRDAILPHQATRLALAEAGGGAALVLVEFIRADGVTRCAAPWSAVVAAARSPRGGPRSVGPEDLTPWLAATPCYLAPFVEEVSRVR